MPIIIMYIKYLSLSWIVYTNTTQCIFLYIVYFYYIQFEWPMYGSQVVLTSYRVPSGEVFYILACNVFFNIKANKRPPLPGDKQDHIEGIQQILGWSVPEVTCEVPLHLVQDSEYFRSCSWDAHNVLSVIKIRADLNLGHGHRVTHLKGCAPRSWRKGGGVFLESTRTSVFLIFNGQFCECLLG